MDGNTRFILKVFLMLSEISLAIEYGSTHWCQLKPETIEKISP